MTFGRWLRHYYYPSGTCGLVVAVIASLLLAGCGGGGVGETRPDPQQSSATVIGRVIDSTSNAGVVGATITYGGTSTTSDASGLFSLTVPAPSPAQPARISAPNYYPRGQYNGQTVHLTVEGIAVPEIAGGQSVDLGTIRLFSTDNPPPPPPI